MIFNICARCFSYFVHLNTKRKTLSFTKSTSHKQLLHLSQHAVIVHRNKSYVELINGNDL